jgi:hypothetical protein
VSHVQAEGLMNSIDEWISAREELGSPSGTLPRRVGVGVFYFESSKTSTE